MQKPTANAARNNLSATKLYALAFGLFLGLCLWKFGNPVILDQKIAAPASLAELLGNPWPTHWARWILVPLALVGAALAFANNLKPLQKERGRPARVFKAEPDADEPSALPIWLWLLPLAWLGWQLLSAQKTVDADLTAATLWQFPAAWSAISSAHFFSETALP